MRKLTNNQTISFDIHRAGDRQSAGLKGLHMHKRMNSKKFKGIDVLFPLDDKEEVEFRPKNTKSQKRTQLLNEVKKVLKKNENKRKELVDTIIQEIERYSEGLPTKERIAAIKTGAGRIARIFSSNEKIEDEMKQEIEDKIQFFVSSHRGYDNKLLYIKQDFKRKRIKISDDRESLHYEVV